MSRCPPTGSYVPPPRPVLAAQAGWRAIVAALSLAAEASVWSVDNLAPDERRRLARHEAEAAVLSGRQVVELGDGFLVVDPAGTESWRSWAAGLDLPAGQSAFDRRLGELITVFGAHGRRPSIRVDLRADTPEDLDRRLTAHGFRASDASLRMWFPARRLEAVVSAADVRRGSARAAGQHSDVTLEFIGGRGDSDIDAADPRIEDAIDVMAAAFGVAPRRGAELRAGMSSGMTVGLARAGGIAVAAGRSALIGEAAYLSAIGVDPRWRRRGFGRLITAALSVAAIRGGAVVVHLNVDPANSTAWQMYQSLGLLAATPAVTRFVLRGR